MRQLIAAVAAALLSACATYTTPASGVSLAAIAESDADIREAFAREPAAAFPVRLAVARVAQSGYRSMTAEGFGRGAYSVVTTRDIESDDAFGRIAGLSRVTGVAPLSRLFLAGELETTKQLREAAAQLRADILLVYTIDSRFRTETTQLGPLQTVALGMLSSRNSTVVSTCAFAFIDVRTGFIYGAGESTEEEDRRSNMWTTSEAIDRARRDAETAAFDAAAKEAEHLWRSILAEHGAT